MPGPLIPIIIAATFIPIVLSWDDIVIWWKGKKIAVLGARTVGKTTLIRFLTTGSIPESYKQTTLPEQVKGRRFQLKDLDLKIKNTWDLAGSLDEYRNWKELFNKADVVFYLLRIDELMKHDTETEKRVRRDMKRIEGWVKELKEKRRPLSHLPHLFIIGTHGDLANPGLTTLPENEQGDYQDRFRAMPIIQECVLRAGGSHKATVLGSLKSRETTEALVINIFKQLEGEL